MFVDINDRLVAVLPTGFSLYAPATFSFIFAPTVIDSIRIYLQFFHTCNIILLRHRSVKAVQVYIPDMHRAFFSLLLRIQTELSAETAARYRHRISSPKDKNAC